VRKYSICDVFVIIETLTKPYEVIIIVWVEFIIHFLATYKNLTSSDVLSQ